MISSLIIFLLRNLFYPRPGTGWTVYRPLSAYLYHSSSSVDFAIFSLHISRISLIILSLNLIVTIKIIKNFSLNYDQISLFPWSSFYYSNFINYIIVVLKLIEILYPSFVPEEMKLETGKGGYDVGTKLPATS